MKFWMPPKDRTLNHKYGVHTNAPVNSEKVLTIVPAREAYYPDNDGIPVVRFWFGDKDYHDWYFDHGEESLRDETISKLVKP